GALVALVCVAACRTRPLVRMGQQSDSVDLAQLVPHGSTDSSLAAPRVITTPSVVLFWLHAADTLSGDDQADTFDDLKYYTAQVAPALAASGIQLVATNADTVFVSLPNARRRTILLSGLDYPYGYLLIDPGGPERIAMAGKGEEGRGKGLPSAPPQVRDCRGCLVIPGLIQAHVHLCQTLFRGLADDLRLEDWLVRRIWPLEAAHTEETLYASALLGAAELLLGGTTAILDMETVRHTTCAFQALARFDAQLHTHAAETIVERETVLRSTGLEEIAYLDSVGIAGPRAALAHCVWVDTHEIDRLARQGTTVVHCPSSNLKLASGVAKIPEMLAAGCRVAIGADGAPCNNGLDAFAEMRLAALIQKPRLAAGALPAAHVRELAPPGGA